MQFVQSSQRMRCSLDDICDGDVAKSYAARLANNDKPMFVGEVRCAMPRAALPESYPEKVIVQRTNKSLKEPPGTSCHIPKNSHPHRQAGLRGFAGRLNQMQSPVR